jgi:enoyl-CoA hydratase/carnithine racemase
MNENISRETFEASVHEQVAEIFLKKGIFGLVTDINESNILIDYIRSAEGNTSVKALFITNEHMILGEQEYDSFIHTIMAMPEPGSESQVPEFTEKNIRFREINILNKIIKVLSEFRKLCFSGIHGDVVTPFIGAALSMDIRYASEGSRFVMAHNKYGLHPSGALPFFLSQYIHHSRALEIQFRDAFSVQEAHSLGLVNKVFRQDGFRERCLDDIQQYIRLKGSTIGLTKRLTNYTRKALSDYFLYEASLLNL